MSIARITSRGRITVPVEVRRAMGIKEGDDLLFERLVRGGARLRVIRRLSKLANALPVTRRYPGKAAVRGEVGRARGKELLDCSFSCFNSS